MQTYLNFFNTYNNRLDIYEKPLTNRGRNNQKIASIACHILQNKSFWFQLWSTIKAAILTIRTWKYIQVANTNILININSATKHSGLEPDVIRQFAREGNLIERLVNQIHPKFVEKRNLERLLTANQTVLNEMLRNRDFFLAHHNPKDIVYHYINGIINNQGEVQSIQIPSEDHARYFAELLTAQAQNPSIQVSLQGGQFEKAITSETLQSVLFPLTNWSQEEIQKKFEELDKIDRKYRAYIEKSITANYTNMTDQQKIELMEEERELNRELEETHGELFQFFQKYMRDINQHHVARTGFLHFRRVAPSRGRPIERIYIKANLRHASELARLIISELYKDNRSEEFSGVLDIKIAGPNVVGRTDGIVIYIGDRQKLPIDHAARDKAKKQCMAVINKLKAIQLRHPEFFSTDPMPFKKVEAPGISTIPGLSTAESFTSKLSEAIVSSLAQAQATDVEDFKNAILDAYSQG